MRVAHLAFLLCLAAPTAVVAQTPNPSADVLQKISLCPKTVEKTCFIGYVTAKSKVLVLLVSDADHPLHGQEVEVASSPGSKEEQKPLQLLDLSRAEGLVVMIDGNGQDRIYGAKLLHTADPLLTALYVSAFLGGPEADDDMEIPSPGK